MSTNLAPERPSFPVGSIRLFSVSFVGQLDVGELLTGVPLVVEQTTTDLTISNKAVNTAALTINGKAVAIGQAVQCLVSGFLTSHRPYTIKVTCATNSTPAETLIGYGQFEVEA